MGWQRGIDHLTKPQHQAWEMLFWVVGYVVQETPKTVQAIDIVLGYHLEVEGKVLLLKTPCTSDLEFWTGVDLSDSFLLED